MACETSACARNVADLPEPGLRTTVVSTFERCCAKPHVSPTLTPTTSGNKLESDNIKPKHAGSVCSFPVVNHLGVVVKSLSLPLPLSMRSISGKFREAPNYPFVTRLKPLCRGVFF